MALISHGSFSDLSFSFPKKTLKKHLAHENVIGLTGPKNLSTLREAARSLQPETIDFIKSKEPRGIAIQSFTLYEGFEGILSKIFSPKEEIYFVALAWDLSGKLIVQYPGKDADKDSCIFPFKKNAPRRFLGAGIPLFPPVPITSGLALRIQVWESDSKARRFGDTLKSLSEAISSSELNSLLTLIAASTGATLATVALIEKAGLELMSIVGTILKTNSDDYVDFYEGYFPASAEWKPTKEMYKGYASEIELSKLS